MPYFKAERRIGKEEVKGSIYYIYKKLLRILRSQKISFFEHTFGGFRERGRITMFIKNNRSGFTLVEIMIVVAIIALLAAVGIPSLLNARRTANDAAASANIKSIATEMETYAAGAGAGAYPVKAELTANSISDRLCADDAATVTAVGGFDYGCTLAAGGYTVTASATTCASTGTTDYTIATGAVSTSAACS